MSVAAPLAGEREVGILLSAQGLTAAFGAKTLFENVSFTVEDGDRIGLVGPNGAGKSTLLGMLAQAALEPRIGGNISRRRGLRVGHVEQVPQFAIGATIARAIREGIASFHAQPASPTGAQGEAAHDDHWEHDLTLRQVMVDLGLARGDADTAIGPDTPVASLSGGWQKRVALAREIARQPDLLLLDEPTNHLDVESIEWLERLIAQARFATVTVTHDRHFLQRVATRILELDHRNAGGLLAVTGNYAEYVRVKSANMEAQERREVVLRNTLRRETEWLRRGAKARSTKQQARIHRAADLGLTVADLAMRNTTRSATLEFQTTDKRAKRLIEARAIGKTYGSRTIFGGVNLLVAPGVRVGLLGANGCGKSTLLRVLLGDEPPSSGSVLRAEGLRVAYFAQDRGVLDPERSVAETVCPLGEHVAFRGARIHVRGYLERFLFTHDQCKLAVGSLSGGEQGRLLLAQLMLQPADVLVLDEPTNDLDLLTLGVLEDALVEHEGAVLLVSHDRSFLDAVATTILAFDTREQAPQSVVPFASLDQWEAWHRQPAVAPAAKRTLPARKRDNDASATTSKRKLGYLEQREYDGIEAKLATAESALRAAIADSEAPASASDAPRLVELLALIAARQAEVDHLYARWAELERSL